MQIKNYGDEQVIIIDKPTDVYVLLDWLQTEFVMKEEEAGKEARRFGKGAIFIESLMDLADAAGFGSMDDVDNIEY